ncbi:hypothetical protein, conserved [Leishmania tarentolae]|uniref:Uncharacterized protein n=1 Tax=Leishmania tarentolae TaxID=5689 RepID=A0A640KZ11_LEITA|nr:hypothetical protein, conserved [Leishmania tarentolae]
MNVAAVYRKVLKQLQKACDTRPHYVQDIRFLLSLPLHTAGSEPSTPVPGATPSTRTMMSAMAADKTPADASKLPNTWLYTTTSGDLVAEHLQRPSCECYPIDTATLFAMSYTDLHNAMRESAPVVAGMNAVAINIVRYRNLLWLQERLGRVLSSKTEQLLATSLSISRGPAENDFIPDEYFESKSNKGGSATVSTTTASQWAAAAVVTGSERREGTAAMGEKATQLSLGKAWKETTESFALTTAGGGMAELVEENDTDTVYSAGAIGQQQEMFVLRHREPFPMAERFLAGFSTITATELATCAYQRAALTELVQQKLSTSLACEDANVSLSVSSEPYDLQYTSKEHAGMGYFASAHRQFRVRFSLEPLSPEGTGPEQNEVLVVNSYFVRLDMELMQLVEEVGYLHSSDVLRMLRERDHGDHTSELVGSGNAELLGEGIFAESNGGKGATGETSSDHRTGLQALAASPAPAIVAKGSRAFSLYFVNHSDAPIVLKGLLYYKLGKRSHLAAAPIHCIPFGFLLMEA